MSTLGKQVRYVMSCLSLLPQVVLRASYNVYRVFLLSMYAKFNLSLKASLLFELQKSSFVVTIDTKLLVLGLENLKFKETY
jgi:hypothetical protein